METSEVICAVSTAPGIGAIAVLRMSGTGCIALADRIFESPSGKTDRRESEYSAFRQDP